MTQTFNEEVVIDGTTDVTQLTVQGSGNQSAPLQTWEDSAANVDVQISGDGRLLVGDDLGLTTEDALVEIHRSDASTSKPTRGLNTLGQISGALVDAIAWLVSELVLKGTGSLTDVFSAFQARVSNTKTDASLSGELHAGDFQVSNAGTSLGKGVGVHSSVTNESGGSLVEAVGVEVEIKDENTPTQLTDAYGIKVNDVNQAATNNYALHTGAGAVRIGDLTGAGDGLVKVDTNGELFRDVGATITPLEQTKQEVYVYQLIYEEIANGGSGQNGIPYFEVTNIPQDGEEIVIEVAGRATNTTTTYLDIQLSGDITSSNYSGGYWYGGASASASIANAPFRLAWLMHSGLTPTTPSPIYNIRIPDYTNGAPKQVRCLAESPYTWPNMYGIQGYQYWEGTGSKAVTSIKLLPSAGNWVDGSEIKVYIKRKLSLVDNVAGDVLSAIGDQPEGSLLTWDSSQQSTILAAGTAGQVLTSNGPNMQPTWQSGSAGGSQLDIGDYKYSARRFDMDNRWLRCDGRTIGNGSSSASARANNDMYNLFVHLWNEFEDSELPVSGGRGADADADWSADKTIELPDIRGRVAMMMDDPTTLDPADQVTDAWADVLGGADGEENHALTTTEMPSHGHYNVGTTSSNWVAPYRMQIGISTANLVGFTTGAAGGGAAHNNIQPSITAGNYFIYTGN